MGSYPDRWDISTSLRMRRTWFRVQNAWSSKRFLLPNHLQELQKNQEGEVCDFEAEPAKVVEHCRNCGRTCGLCERLEIMAFCLHFEIVIWRFDQPWHLLSSHPQRLEQAPVTLKGGMRDDCSGAHAFLFMRRKGLWTNFLKSYCSDEILKPNLNLRTWQMYQPIWTSSVMGLVVTDGPFLPMMCAVPWRDTPQTATFPRQDESSLCIMVR